MKDIKKRAILATVAVILLVGLLLYTTVAWYTKMVSIQGLSFNAARWDFSANYQIDDFEINVYKYDSIGEYGTEGTRFAAPGTKGEIQMLVSAERSNTDVGYIITVDKSTASEEFQKRLYFYYEDANNNRIEFDNESGDTVYMTGTVEYGTTEVVTILWEWVYDYDEFLYKKNPTKYAFAQIVRPIYESAVGLIYTADDFISLYEYCDPIIENQYPNGKKAVLNILKGLTDTERAQFYTDVAGSGYFSGATMLSSVTYLTDDEYETLKSYSAYLSNSSAWQTLYEEEAAMQEVFDILDGINETSRAAFFADEANILAAATAPDYLTAEQFATLQTYKTNHSTSLATHQTTANVTTYKDLYNTYYPFSYERLWERVDFDEFAIQQIYASKDSNDMVSYMQSHGSDTDIVNMSIAGGADLFTEEELSKIAAYRKAQIDAGNTTYTISTTWNNYNTNKSLYNVIDILYNVTNSEREICFANEKSSTPVLTTMLDDTKVSSLKTYAAAKGFSSVQAALDDYITSYEEFDKFDTLVGLDPDLYEKEMKAVVKVTGTQVTPVNGTNS